MCVFQFVLYTAGREKKNILYYMLVLSSVSSVSHPLRVLLPSLQSTLLCVGALNLSVTTFILLYPSMNPIYLHSPAFPPPPSTSISLSSSSITPVVWLQQTRVAGHANPLLSSAVMATIWLNTQ